MLSLATPTAERDLLGRAELQGRVLYRSEHELRDTYERAAFEERRLLRLSQNKVSVHALESDERLDREDIELMLDLGYDMVRQAVEDAWQSHRNLSVMRSRREERCDRLFTPRIQREIDSDMLQEKQERANGRTLLCQEREMIVKHAAQRNADVLQRQKEADSVRTAQAFVAGEETRDRASILKEQEGALRSLVVQQRRDEVSARQLEQLNFENSDEQRRLAADREKKATEERQVAMKRELEFKKEQHRLVTKCTHSRTGGSVFVGPVPRKVCLVCRVRLDEATGIYVRMT